MDTRRPPPARHAFAWLAAVALVLVLGACKPRAPADAAPSPPGLPSADAQALFPPDQDSERTWVGVLPCSDCQGVDTRLVLRMRGGRRDYLLTETYLAPGGAQRFNRAGAWRESRIALDGDQATVFQLDPAQSGPQYAVQPDGALELLDGNGRAPADPVAYRMQRL
jgi:hypothetical protein